MLVYMCQYLTLDVLRHVAAVLGVPNHKSKNKKQLCEHLMAQTHRTRALKGLPRALLFRHATDAAVAPLRRRAPPEFVTALKGVLRRRAGPSSPTRKRKP